MNKRETKKEISELVKKYQRIAKAGKIKSYNEAQTRNEFIEPLFGFLGWDMRNANNDNEVTTEETISRGRADLAFRINGIPKFFLEAKSLKVDLDIESYARQAINYSWNKGINWAVLTDFENIKIFNANAKSKSLRDKLVFEISHNEYIQDFERLLLLSKESFEKNALDIYAEKHGKKSKSLTVNEKLFGDLKQAREILTKSFDNWKGSWDKNKNIDQETLDEGVQRIIDRLVFIRVLEDKKLEEPILQPIVRKWEKDRSNNKQLFQMLTEKFRELDDVYNSSLFTKHACEGWEEYDDATKKAIELLYGNDVYEYNFKEIPADILGGVYESYLGYIAQKPIEAKTKKKSEKLSKAKDKKDLKIKSRQKRKEQGIYYTPNFIVDYIIKNTLGKKLEEIKSVNDLKQIKILDPACGSGSFLIKALETVNEKYKDFGNPGNQYTKSGILLGNIYGVDLDPQAVELAKLNLLINALDQKAKLPNLTDNIRVGNSLISGSEKELKKYFGKNWRDKKAFNWEEEFPFCHSQFSSCHSRGGGNPEDGFDVIIGNPPYVNAKNSNFSKEEKDYFNNSFKTAAYQLDTYILFIEKSINLLKENGFLGFIMPNSWLSNLLFIKIRKFLLDNTKIIEIVETKDKIFGSANVDVVVLIIQKNKNNQNNRIQKGTFTHGNYEKNYLIPQTEFNKDDLVFNINISAIGRDLIKKIDKNSIRIKNILDVSTGIKEYQVGKGIPSQTQKDKDKLKFHADFKKDKTYLPEIRGKNIGRYTLNWNNEYVSYGKWIAEPRTPKYFSGERILVRKIPGINNLVISYTNEDFVIDQSIYIGIIKNKKFNLEYILAILNSKLIG